MANSNRAPLIAKAHKVLKQHYKVGPEHDERPLLEQLLFACCLENAPYDAANKVYDRLKQNYFDWNEVRVSTVTELAEAMRKLPDPSAAAANLKRVLQGVFESTYSFDLELLKKQNISAGIQKLQEHEGITPFVLAYAVQHALAGHSIPLDRGALDVLFFVGIATPAEQQSGSVTGLERAIPKNKGIEFGSLLHQLAADYIAAPHSPNVKKVLLAVNPEATMPKRGSPKVELKPAEVKSAKSVDAKSDGKSTSKDGKAPDSKSNAEPDKKSKATAGDKAGEKNSSSDKSHGPKPGADKNTTDKSAKAAGKNDRHPTDKPAGKSSAPAGSAQAQLDKARKSQKPVKPDKPTDRAMARPSVQANRADKKRAPDKKALPNRKVLPAKKSNSGKSSSGSSKKSSATKQLAKKKPR